MRLLCEALQRSRPLLVERSISSQSSHLRHLQGATRLMRTQPREHARKEKKPGMAVFFKGRPNWKKIKAYKPRPFLEVSDTVLDLVDERTNYTRDYTEHDKAEQGITWSSQLIATPVLERALDFQKELAILKANWKNPAGPFQPRRLTDRGVLCVAFLGVSRPDHSSPQQLVLEDHTPAPNEPNLGLLDTTLLRSIGLSDLISDDIPLAVERLHCRLTERQLPIQFTDENAFIMAKALERALAETTFQRVQRTIAPLLQSPEGCHFLWQHRDKVLQACMQGPHLLDNDAHAQKVYIFLKNVSRNLAAQSLDLGLSSATNQEWRELEECVLGRKPAE